MLQLTTPCDSSYMFYGVISNSFNKILIDGKNSTMNITEHTYALKENANVVAFAMNERTSNGNQDKGAKNCSLLTRFSTSYIKT